MDIFNFLSNNITIGTGILLLILNLGLSHYLTLKLNFRKNFTMKKIEVYTDFIEALDSIKGGTNTVGAKEFPKQLALVSLFGSTKVANLAYEYISEGDKFGDINYHDYLYTELINEMRADTNQYFFNYKLNLKRKSDLKKAFKFDLL